MSEKKKEVVKAPAKDKKKQVTPVFDSTKNTKHGAHGIGCRN